MMIRKRVYSALITLSLTAVMGNGVATTYAFAATSGSTTRVSSATHFNLTASDLQLARLKLGATLSTAQKLYGKPTMKTILHGNGAPVWVYKFRGLALYGPKIWGIILTAPNTNKTVRGIHVGSTESEVLTAYPKIHVYRHSNGDSLVQYSSDRRYFIDIEIRQGRLRTILLEQPL